MNEACALSQQYVEDGETPAPRESKGENPAYSVQVSSLIVVNHQQKSTYARRRVFQPCTIFLFLGSGLKVLTLAAKGAKDTKE
jgi:hypothetical protein